MRIVPLQIVLASLLLAASPASKVTARWSLSGSELAFWDVFVLGEDGASRTPRTPNLALSLFGYQIDRSGEARYPAHRVEEIPYDLALRVPVGRVRKGQQVRTEVRYAEVRDHRPIDVAIAGKVVEVAEKTLRIEAKLVGVPATQYDSALHGFKPWLTRITGELEITFDHARGIMTSAEVLLEARSLHIDEGKREDAPEPTEAKHRFGFELRTVRKDDSWDRDITVGRAISKGTAWLRGKILEDGTYGVYDFHRKYPHAETSFAALTLLRCGADREDPFILGLMEKIRGFQPIHTYELGVALMAMEAFYAPADEVDEVHGGRRTIPRTRVLEKEDLAWVQGLVDRLISLAEKKHDGWGWGYGTDLPRPDLSNTQYAALGLLAGWRCGARIPEEAWVQMANGVLRHQTGKGKHPLTIERVGDPEKGTRTGRARVTAARALSYVPGGVDQRASMTCGGVATLKIARDVLQTEGSAHVRGRLGKRIDVAIEQAWAWMAQNWLIQRHTQYAGGDWLLYYLYALERAGILCRVRKINGHDWYREGAAWLVGTQAADGHWQDSSAAVHDTCFALLFLKRATIPIAEPTTSGR